MPNFEFPPFIRIEDRLIQIRGIVEVEFHPEWSIFRHIYNGEERISYSMDVRDQVRLNAEQITRPVLEIEYVDAEGQGNSVRLHSEDALKMWIFMCEHLVANSSQVMLGEQSCNVEDAYLSH